MNLVFYNDKNKWYKCVTLFPVEMGKEAKEEENAEDEGRKVLNDNHSSPSSLPHETEEKPPSSTTDAQKILSLLSEIGSNQMLHDDFHPWFWDASQGKLMTV